MEVEMKAVKVFNNNVIATVMEDGRESVVVGPGIGFGKRPGNLVDESKIEKIYYVQNRLQTRFLQLLEDATAETLQAAEDILSYAMKQGMLLNNKVIVSLTDHISFALERNEQGICLPNLMLSEIRMLYPKEYEVGKWALKHIRKVCGVQLPGDEAGYIALQLANASMDENVAYDILKFVKGATDIIKENYGLSLEEDQLETMRLTTHLKFLAQRILKNGQWKDEDMGDLYELLYHKHPKNKACVEKLTEYIEDTFHYKLNRQEIIYLLVHLTKII